MKGSHRRYPIIFGLGLILALLAFYAFVLVGPSAPVAVGKANPSDMHPSAPASLKVVAPVSTRIYCASCHCDPRGASTGYSARSRNDTMADTLTLQDFLKESKYVPLLVRPDPDFCASGNAGSPGYQFDEVIRFLHPWAQPGT